MERLAARMGGSVKFPFNKSECLDADFFKIVADHLIRESGVRPLLHCLAVEVIKEGEVVRGIVTESKSGRQAILADRVIDCTGDADIAYLAGARCTRVNKSEAMGMTTVGERLNGMIGLSLNARQFFIKFLVKDGTIPASLG